MSWVEISDSEYRAGDRLKSTHEFTAHAGLHQEGTIDKLYRWEEEPRTRVILVAHDEIQNLEAPTVKELNNGKDITHYFK